MYNAPRHACGWPRAPSAPGHADPPSDSLCRRAPPFCCPAQPDDAAAERAADAALAHLPSDADLGVLVPGAAAAAAAPPSKPGAAAAAAAPALVIAEGEGAAAAEGGEGEGEGEDDGRDLGPEADAALEQFAELYKDVRWRRILRIRLRGGS
jgi:hypothetical protein